MQQIFVSTFIFYRACQTAVACVLLADAVKGPTPVPAGYSSGVGLLLQTPTCLTRAGALKRGSCEACQFGMEVRLPVCLSIGRVERETCWRSLLSHLGQRTSAPCTDERLELDLAAASGVVAYVSHDR